MTTATYKDNNNNSNKKNNNKKKKKNNNNNMNRFCHSAFGEGQSALLFLKQNLHTVTYMYTYKYIHFKINIRFVWQTHSKNNKNNKNKRLQNPANTMRNAR